MGHLVRNGAAVAITDKEELYEKLSACLKDAHMREGAALNGLKTAKLCHTAEIQSEKLYKILEQ